jgi:hypothetical protein
MYIKADQIKFKQQLSIAIGNGLVLTFQSLSIPPVLAQTNQNNTNTENLSSKIKTYFL